MQFITFNYAIYYFQLCNLLLLLCNLLLLNHLNTSLTASYTSYNRYYKYIITQYCDR